MSGTHIPVPDVVKARLLRSAEDPRPVVLMTCGIAGSGKSTLAKAVVASFPSFTRVSTDQIIFGRHGICGVDYAASRYEAFSEEADGIYVRTYRQLLQDGNKDVVLDRSFYAKEDRDEYRKIAAEAGARCVLVYFSATSRDVLWRRIRDRRAAGVNADCALDISEELLDMYFEGFDVPAGEGEIVIQVE